MTTNQKINAARAYIQSLTKYRIRANRLNKNVDVGYISPKFDSDNLSLEDKTALDLIQFSKTKIGKYVYEFLLTRGYITPRRILRSSKNGSHKKLSATKFLALCNSCGVRMTTVDFQNLLTHKLFIPFSEGESIYFLEVQAFQLYEVQQFIMRKGYYVFLGTKQKYYDTELTAINNFWVEVVPLLEDITCFYRKANTFAWKKSEETQNIYDQMRVYNEILRYRTSSTAKNIDKQYKRQTAKLLERVQEKLVRWIVKNNQLVRLAKTSYHFLEKAFDKELAVGDDQMRFSLLCKIYFDKINVHLSVLGEHVLPLEEYCDIGNGQEQYCKNCHKLLPLIRTNHERGRLSAFCDNDKVCSNKYYYKIKKK